MSEAFVGEIRMFGGNYAPVGWELCNGQLLSIAGNEVLFTLIGTTYGGDGQSTFALPDLRGRSPLHQGTGGGSTPRVLGQKDGVESVSLTQNQLPAHTHMQSASTASASSVPAANAVPAAWPDSPYRKRESSVPLTALAAGAVGATGAGQPHPNMPPFLPISFIIATVGNFPSRD